MLLLTGFLLVRGEGGPGNVYESAYEFTSTDYKGAEFSLSENAGKVTIIHFTQLENPICIECEEFIRQQIIELQDLVSLEAPGIDVITVNIRKNSYSEDGWSMAQEWYGANITWHWVEEFEPYPISANYIQFWQLNGAFSNPSIVLVDQEMMVVGVYHVYCIGKGVVDGVRSAESLSEDAEAVLSGEWEIQSDDGFQHEGATMGGMFLLGVVTSFSPCSLALLMAIVSFVGASSARALGGAKGSPSVGVGLRIGVTFTIGTAAVFLVFGLFISYVGDFVQVSTVFFLVAGAILVVLGLNILFPIFTWLKLRFSSLGSRSRKPTCSLSSTQEQPLGRLHRLSVKSPDLAGVVLGILFSVGWAPCALSLTLPIMILLVTQDISIWTGGLMMLAFGLGHGAAIIPFCAATGEVRGVVGNKYMSLARGVQKAFAIAVVVLGFLFMARFFGFDLW